MCAQAQNAGNLLIICRFVGPLWTVRHHFALKPRGLVQGAKLTGIGKRMHGYLKHHASSFDRLKAILAHLSCGCSARRLPQHDQVLLSG